MDNYDSISLFMRNVDKLVEAAKTAREKEAISWRNYLVGESLLGPNGEIYAGGNMKPHENSQTFCGIESAAKKARLEGCKDIIAICIVARPQDGPTLLHCHRCLKLLPDLYGVKDKTLVYSISIEPDGPVRLHTFGQIRLKYELK